jgi:hypothetical protein
MRLSSCQSLSELWMLIIIARHGPQKPHAKFTTTSEERRRYEKSSADDNDKYNFRSGVDTT